MYSGDDVPPQPPAPVQQPSPYGYAMGTAGDAAAAWLPAPNVAPPTAASAAGYPPGAASSASMAGPCRLTSTAVLFGDLVVVCLVMGTGAGLMWDGVLRGGGRGFLRGAGWCDAMRCGAGSG
ncbi:unnamed protein product [Taenia asiatica]|uniref:Uncharacterized protein n=1 Tax=Taenia asiatica TaxID=60517 RepID=A0A0R3VYM4_TAEAS|nr:unnamed protein product [Taenia asiatica]